MTADITQPVIDGADNPHVEGDHLASALISHLGLSHQDVARIMEAMQAQEISFGQAACQLGLATQKDTAAVQAWLRGERGIGSAGIFERAVHSARFSTSTALTVRRGVARQGNLLQHTNIAGDRRNEQISALRTDLMMLNDSAQRSNVFAFLSPGRSEGRSQLCAELAIAFAQLGRRTLLVDADLRHPRQHVLFNSDNQWGLSQALAKGDAPYLNSVEGLPQLTLLTSGPVPHNPLDLLSQARFERLATSLRNQYDFVLIDTPAVSHCADALQIASVARHVVAVSRAGVTSFDDMKDMLRRLAMTESGILGAVLNKF